MPSGWTHALIAGKPADVFEPPGRARGAVLFLHPHGLETLAAAAANPAHTDALARHGLACCCPYTWFSWWTDRPYPVFDPHLTAERHLLQNVLPWMRQRWRGPVAVCGISMGGQGALRLAFKHPDVFPVAAGVASAFEYDARFAEPELFPELQELYDSREACRQDTAILHVDPHRYPPHLWFACDPADAYHRGADRLHEKLTALGIAHAADLDTSAGGHSWAYFNAMADPMLGFAGAALEKEARRLV